MKKEKKGTSRKTRTEVGRVSYPSLFTPTMYEGDEKTKKWSITLLFKKDDNSIAPVQNACMEALTAQFGAEKAKTEKWHSPIKDGDEMDMEKNPEYKGHYFCEFKINYKTKAGKVNQAPKVVGTERDQDGKLLPLYEADGEIYGGCYGRVTFVAAYYKSSMVAEKQGVTLYLNNFQKTSDGDAFGGAGDPNDDFPEEDAISDEARNL